MSKKRDIFPKKDTVWRCLESFKPKDPLPAIPKHQLVYVTKVSKKDKIVFFTYLADMDIKPSNAKMPMVWFVEWFAYDKSVKRPRGR